MNKLIQAAHPQSSMKRLIRPIRSAMAFRLTCQMSHANQVQQMQLNELIESFRFEDRLVNIHWILSSG